MKSVPSLNLSREYQVIAGGKVCGTFHSATEARAALAKFSPRVGAYINYPIGALNRDHLEAKRRKETRKDTADDTRAIHSYLERVKPEAPEYIEPVTFEMPRKLEHANLAYELAVNGKEKARG